MSKYINAAGQSHKHNRQLLADSVELFLTIKLTAHEHIKNF